MSRLFGLLMFVVLWGLQKLLTMAVGDTVFESDGESVTVEVDEDVVAGQVAYVEGWLGLVVGNTDSGDNAVLNINQKEYQFIVPAGLSVSKGDIVYVDTAQVTVNTPDDAAYSTSAGSGKVALFKATSDKDDNDVVLAILIVK